MNRRVGSVAVTRKKQEEREVNTSSYQWPAGNSQCNLAAGIQTRRSGSGVGGGAKQRWSVGVGGVVERIFVAVCSAFDSRQGTLLICRPGKTLSLVGHGPLFTPPRVDVCQDCRLLADSWRTAWLITMFELMPDVPVRLQILPRRFTTGANASRCRPKLPPCPVGWDKTEKPPAGHPPVLLIITQPHRFKFLFHFV